MSAAQHALRIEPAAVFTAGICGSRTINDSRRRLIAAFDVLPNGALARQSERMFCPPERSRAARARRQDTAGQHSIAGGSSGIFGSLTRKKGARPHRAWRTEHDPSEVTTGRCSTLAGDQRSARSSGGAGKERMVRLTGSARPGIAAPALTENRRALADSRREQ